MSITYGLPQNCERVFEVIFFQLDTDTTMQQNAMISGLWHS